MTTTSRRPVTTRRKCARRAARDEGMQKGIAEGMQKGIAEGRAEERLSIARSMKEKGLDTATILSITGISEAELATL